MRIHLLYKPNMFFYTFELLHANSSKCTSIGSCPSQGTVKAAGIWEVLFQVPTQLLRASVARTRRENQRLRFRAFRRRARHPRKSPRCRACTQSRRIVRSWVVSVERFRTRRPRFSVRRCEIPRGHPRGSSLKLSKALFLIYQHPGPSKGPLWSL